MQSKEKKEGIISDIMLKQWHSKLKFYRKSRKEEKQGIETTHKSR